MVVLWMVGSLLWTDATSALCSSPGSQRWWQLACCCGLQMCLWPCLCPPPPPPALLQVQPIFKQFPLTCNVTNKLYRGWDTKIVAFRVSAAVRPSI